MIAAFLTASATLLTAGIVIVGGVWLYHRQKEYELVQRRYLEGGFDVLISTAETSLNIVSHNWARCLEVVKSFRELDIKAEDLEKGFLQLPETRFSLTANYRVNRVLNSPIVWPTFQLVIAFCQNSSSKMVQEIPLVLRQALTTSALVSRSQIAADAFSELKKLQEESHRYHVFVGHMHTIAALFEQQRFRFKNIDKLREHKDVVEALKALEEAFGDKLKPYASSDLDAPEVQESQQVQA